MEANWNREAVRFAQGQLSALVVNYEGDPADFIGTIDVAWRKHVATLQARIDALPTDVGEGSRFALAQQAAAADEAMAAASVQATAVQARVVEAQQATAAAKKAADNAAAVAKEAAERAAAEADKHK